MHILRYVIAVILAFIALTANAMGTDRAVQGPERMTNNNWGGLIAQLPAHTPHELLGQVQELHSNLLARQTELQKIVVGSKFKTKDMFITIIMPGGLAYAAHKKLQQKRAESELESVTSELGQLSKDLLMLQSASGESTVAMLHQP